LLIKILVVSNLFFPKGDALALSRILGALIAKPSGGWRNMVNKVGLREFTADRLAQRLCQSFEKLVPEK
jgi:hypothetical protein